MSTHTNPIVLLIKAIAVEEERGGGEERKEMGGEEGDCPIREIRVAIQYHMDGGRGGGGGGDTTGFTWPLGLSDMV